MINSLAVLVDNNYGYILGGCDVVVGLELEGGPTSMKVTLQFT